MFHLMVFRASSGGGGGGNFPAGITSGSPADAIVNVAVTGLDTRNFLEIFNGTTWDRLRDANSSVGTGTGVLGVGVLGFDGTNFQKLVTLLSADATPSQLGLFVNGQNEVYNGTNWDRQRAVNTVTGTTGTGLPGHAVMGFDGTNYNRVTEAVPADAVVNANISGLDTRAFNFLYNGTTWDRVKGVTSAQGTTGTGLLGAAILGFDGTNYQRIRMGTAVSLAAATQATTIMVVDPGQWGQAHTPAVATQATTTKAAGGAGVRHLCKSISFSLFAAAAVGPLQVNLRDGTTGAGTILWSMTVQLALGQLVTFSSPPLNIFGTANTAMTLEFSAAPGAADSESVSISGFSTA